MTAQEVEIVNGRSHSAYLDVTRDGLLPPSTILKRDGRIVAFDIERIENALTRCFAEALAPSVSVNCVAPGLTQTDMLGGLDADKLHGRVAAIPLGRVGRPEEVAETIAFLLSKRASYLTGECITVSGGDVMT